MFECLCSEVASSQFGDDLFYCIVTRSFEDLFEVYSNKSPSGGWLGDKSCVLYNFYKIPLV